MIFPQQHVVYRGRIEAKDGHCSMSRHLEGIKLIKHEFGAIDGRKMHAPHLLFKP